MISHQSACSSFACVSSFEKTLGKKHTVAGLPEFTRFDSFIHSYMRVLVSTYCITYYLGEACAFACNPNCSALICFFLSLAATDNAELLMCVECVFFLLFGHFFLFRSFSFSLRQTQRSAAQKKEQPLFLQ